MLLYILKAHNQKGQTLVDLLVYIAVTAILLSVVILSINPTEQQRRARDEKRLADLSALETAIIEYRIDFDTLPDAVDTLRQSTVLPTGNIGPLFDLGGDGWIDADFSNYRNSILPIDPLNDGTYFYTYQHDGTYYELNATMEYLTTEMSTDGGNDPDLYEVGDSLTIITP